MRRSLAALTLALCLFQTNAHAHGIGAIDCKDWYKNVFVAALCGIGAVIEAPFALMDYIDEKSLTKAGILRKEGYDYNEYLHKKSGKKFAIFNMRSSSLADAQEKCASVNGKIATKEESDLLHKGASHDADILYARTFLHYGPDHKLIDSAITGFVENQGSNDVFLFYSGENRMVYKSSAEIKAMLDQSQGNGSRANFDYNGILQPICTIE